MLCVLGIEFHKCIYMKLFLEFKIDNKNVFGKTKERKEIMKLKHVVKKVITFFLCASMMITSLDVGAIGVQNVAAAEMTSTNLLKNGTFEDLNSDGKVDSWSYYFGDYGEGESQILADGGVEMSSVSNVNKRLTLYQQNISSTDMEYNLTGTMNISNFVSGNITFRLTASDGTNKQEINGTAYSAKGTVTLNETFTVTSLTSVQNVKFEIIVSNGATLVATLNNISLKGTTTETELLTNGTFADANSDNKADGWSYYNGTSVIADTEIVSGGGLKIICQTKERLTLHQTVTSGIEKGKTYILSGQVQVTNTSNGAFTVRYITQNSSSGQIEKVENPNYKIQSATDGWQTVTYEIPVEENSNVARIKVEIEVSAGATLTAQAKDFSLVEKVDVPTESETSSEPGTTETESETSSEPGTTETESETSSEPGTTETESETSSEPGTTETESETSSETETPAPEPVEPEYTGGLLINGSFLDAKPLDGVADGWTNWNGSVVAADVSFSAEKGMTIAADSTSAKERLTVHQTVNLEKEKTYDFTGKLNVEATTKGSVEIRYVDPTSTSGTVRVEYKTSATDGWVDFAKKITIPEEAEKTAIKFEIVVSEGATLTASVKDFVLVEGEKEPEDDGKLLKNATYTTTDVTTIPEWAYYPTVMTHGTDYSASVSDGAVTLKALTKDIRLMQGVNCASSDLDAMYTLTGQMKADALSSKAYVQVRLNNGLDVVATSPSVTGTTATGENPDGWVDFSITFEVPSAYYNTNDLYYNKNGIVYQDKAPQAITLFKVEQCVAKGTGSASFRNLEVVKGEAIANNIVVGDADNTLIVNGGFDREYADFPRWWFLWESAGGLKATVDRTNVYSENSQASIHIQNVIANENSRGSVHQTIKAGYVPDTLQGQAVKISQWIKTEDFTLNKLSIRLQYTTNSGEAVDMTSKTIDVKSTQDWTYYEYILDMQSNDLKTIKLEYLYDEAQGHVWIDEVSMTEYIKAKGISIDNEKIVLAKGDTATFNLSFTPANTTIQEVTCTSADVSVASVVGSGTSYTVIAVDEGTTKLKLKHVDGVEKEIAILVTSGMLDYQETIDTITTTYETKKTGTLPTGYTYSVAAKPQYGTFVIENGNAYTYYPNNQFSGTDTVTVLVEKDGKTALVTINLSVSEMNEAPVFDEFLVLTDKGVAVTGDLKATNAEAEALTFAVKAQPENAGTITVTGKKYTFTPAADFTGLDNSGIMQVTDAYGNVTEAVVRIYVAPTGSVLRATVKTEHPRLLADDDKFALLKDSIVNNENIKLWFNRDVKASTDALFDAAGVYTPTVWNLSDGVRLDTTGSKNITKIAFVYVVTGEQKYYDAAILELKALCGDAYPDWNPSHLLDVAMTANGVALAYDWLYTKMKAEDPEVLALVEQALYEKCLVVADEMYDTNHMFVTNENNWNYVCNGGFVTTAMALSDHENADYIAKVDNVLNKAYKSIQYGLPQYAPEGDSIEGVSYWAYGTQYLVSLLASISSATTVENPFLNTPGLDLTALYPIYMTGKAGTYNYADNDMADPVGYLNLWFAEAYDEPAYAWYHKYYMADPSHKASIYDLLYYNPDYYNSDEVPELLDYFYTSQAVTAMRHDYNDADSSFLGFKGGETGSPHGDLDIGSFVYDIYGIRWAFDFGKDDYNLLGYWELDAEGTRWNYYRKNALGHNTIAINPEKGGNQTIGQYAAAIEKNLNNPGGGYVILDMTDVYQKNAVDVKRGFAYINRTQALIRDEFTLKDFGDIYWQMHTHAAVEISADGKTATLTQDRKSIELRLFNENGSDYKFETMRAVAYEGIGTADGENANEGVTKIVIKASNIQKGVFNVLLTPVDEVSPEVKELASWSEYDFSKLVEDDKTEDDTEDSTEDETEKDTEGETEKDTEGETEKDTEGETEKDTEGETEKDTEKETEKNTETETSTNAPTNDNQGSSTERPVTEAPTEAPATESSTANKVTTTEKASTETTEAPEVNTKVEAGEDAPKVNVGNMDKLYSNPKLFTEKDKQIINAGGKVKFVFEVQKVEESKVTEADKEKIVEIKQEDFVIGMFLDLSVSKEVYDARGEMISDRSEKAISDLGEEQMLKVTIELSPEMCGKAEYKVYRIHDGVAEELASGGNGERIEVNKDRNQLTLYTYKFSTYAISYSEKAADVDETVNTEAEVINTELPEATPEAKKTGSAAPWLVIGLLAAVIAFVVVKKKK